jgi:hypothetical protein
MNEDETTTTTIDAPVVETPAVDTPAVDTPATDGQARGPDGKFVATPAPATDTPAAPVVPDTSAVAATTRTIKGRVNGQPVEVVIPVGFELPVKRGKEETFAPFEEIEKAPLLQRDYTLKTQGIAQQRRELEARAAELEARNEQAREDRTRYLKAMEQGGEVAKREIEHLQRLELDPDYRARYEESEEFRISRKMEEHHETVDSLEVEAKTADRIRSYIADESAKYPGIDPERVAQIYGMALSSGRLTRMHRDDVDEVIRGEVQLMQRGAAPVSGELETLKKEVARLSAALEAQAHNSKVVAAIDRTGKPPVGAPGRGAVPGEAPFEPFNPDKESREQFQTRWNARRTA